MLTPCSCRPSSYRLSRAGCRSTGCKSSGHTSAGHMSAGHMSAGFKSTSFLSVASKPTASASIASASIASKPTASISIALITLAFISTFAFSTICSSVAFAAGYRQPSAEVMNIIKAPTTPSLSLQRNGLRATLAYWPIACSLEDLAQPEVTLAGLKINPVMYSQSNQTFYKKIEIVDLQGDKNNKVLVRVPKNPRLGDIRWTLDSKNIVFTHWAEKGVELWTADTTSGKSRRLIGPHLNNILASYLYRTPNPRKLIVRLRSEEPLPQKPKVPQEPITQETSGQKAAVRTYQNLLETPADCELFAALAKTQLAFVNIDNGRIEKIGKPDIYGGIELSPDGKWLIVDRYRRPFSYTVPCGRFAKDIELWNLRTREVTIIAKQPIGDKIPIMGVRTGRRFVHWHGNKPARLMWVEALDEGDPEKTVPHRDALFAWEAPFHGEAEECCRLVHRIFNLNYLRNRDDCLVYEHDWRKRWIKVYLRDLMKGTEKLIFDYSHNDVYKDPGTAVTTRTAQGESLVRVDNGDTIYLAGSGATPSGERPFLRSLSLKTLQVKELFRSGMRGYERFSTFIGGQYPPKSILTRYETPTLPPNYCVRSLKGEKRTRFVTNRIHPAPQLKRVKKRILKYKRADGTPLSGILYLPPDYKESEKNLPENKRRPCVLWAYPRSYSGKATAGQVRGSDQRFTLPRGFSHLFFLLKGYIVLDKAQIPVVGDPKTMNDTFVEQIVSSAQAAIDALHGEKLIDRKKVGVGGHSYGAFMTANLLAHCDLFAAGIGRSGAYNRTLTPFGFQSERRTLWEAKDIYIKLSPFLSANKINEPLLLVHGVNDSNPGTYPIQSKRLFHALKGLGGKARLVLLPLEDHGYRSIESSAHVVAESFDWFDKYVKQAK